MFVLFRQFKYTCNTALHSLSLLNLYECTEKLIFILNHLSYYIKMENSENM